MAFQNLNAYSDHSWLDQGGYGQRDLADGDAKASMIRLRIWVLRVAATPRSELY